jgi:hypothetical protein
MKKALALLSIIAVVQGSLLLGREYENLQAYFDSSKVTKKCLDDSESYLLNAPCECLNQDLVFFRKQFEHHLSLKKSYDKITEDDLVNLKNLYLYLVRQQFDKHKEAIHGVLYHGKGLDRTSEEKLEMQEEFVAYQGALEKVAGEVFADAQLKYSK